MTSIPSSAGALPAHRLGDSAGALLHLSAPIVLSQLAQMGSAVVDVLMAGRLDTAALGAVATGAAVWTPVMIFLLGLLYALIPAIGRLRGEGREHAVRATVARGLAVGLGGGALLGAAMAALAVPLFRAAGVDPALIPDAGDYVRLVAFGLPGMGLFLAMRFLVEAYGAPMPVTATIVLGVALKVLCNLAFVFGHFGATPLGVSGFGVSTLVAFWATGLVMAALALRHPRLRGAWQGPLAAADLGGRALLRFCTGGLPIAFNFLSDYLVMAVVAIFIATLGAAAIGSHQIAFNVLMILLMAPTGLSMAATILIARVAGGGDRAEARRLIGLTLGIGLALAVPLALLASFRADTLAALYSRDPAVLAATAELLRIVAWLLALDVLVIALGFVLRGLGDAAGPFVILAAVHWLFSIPLGHALCFTDRLAAPLGTVGWWYALAAGLALAAALLLWRLGRRFAHFPWKTS
ncbi:MAG: MATE family efflux transporter [Rhodocyclaceae bacterium]|nr:MATE family efflux transporter [Rhodocyclaceae bacterium]